MSKTLSYRRCYLKALHCSAKHSDCLNSLTFKPMLLSASCLGCQGTDRFQVLFQSTLPTWEARILGALSLFQTLSLCSPIQQHPFFFGCSSSVHKLVYNCVRWYPNKNDELFANNSDPSFLWPHTGLCGTEVTDSFIKQENSPTPISWLLMHSTGFHQGPTMCGALCSTLGTQT